MAIIRLLQDNPDGKNLIQIKKELGYGVERVRLLVKKLVANGTIKEMEVGKSRVFVL